jgi:hypothetical protein
MVAAPLLVQSRINCEGIPSLSKKPEEQNIAVMFQEADTCIGFPF